MRGLQSRGCDGSSCLHRGSHQQSNKGLRIRPMIAFDQLALQSGAAVLDAERLIAGIRFAITGNSVDSELTPVWINEKPITRDLDAISNRTRLRERAYQCTSRDD